MFCCRSILQYAIDLRFRNPQQDRRKEFAAFRQLYSAANFCLLGFAPRLDDGAQFSRNRFPFSSHGHKSFVLEAPNLTAIIIVVISNNALTSFIGLLSLNTQCVCPTRKVRRAPAPSGKQFFVHYPLSALQQWILELSAALTTARVKGLSLAGGSR